MLNLFVVISGETGAGKSSLAPPLAAELDLPLLGKDTIKEALGDSLGASSVEESKRLGAATMRVLFALAGRNRGAVMESTWVPELARDELAALPGRVAEVYCDVPLEIARARYAARVGTRHAVHFDAERLAAHDWTTRTPPVGGDWPLIVVDTTKPVVIAALAHRVRHAHRL